MNIKYLTKEDILLIHSIVIDETGGSHGIRDMHAILTLEELPNQQAFGKELYPTLFLKAALYLRNIVFSHPFIDGNKRTGITSASVFLEDNNCLITTSSDELENFPLEIIKQKLSLEKIAHWLEMHCSCA